ncbi:hypothetical protein [Streptomyces liangshanensis]|uniref:hypothetical protein n=1 Tax=Streptomyces liangshanensis TaxID=2717324 RepID=UPI0036D9719E
MNRLAPHRSPVSLLTCCALLLGMLAAVLALSTPARAADEPIGTFTLEPATGSTADVLSGTLTTSAPCPAPADPASPYQNVRVELANADGTYRERVATSVDGAPFDGTDPVVADLSRPGPDGPANVSLDEAALYTESTGPDGRILDGDYVLAAGCAPADNVVNGYFSAVIRVTAGTWSLVQVRSTQTTLTADPSEGPAGRTIDLTATVTPAEAAGSVVFRSTHGTPAELGSVAVTDGRARITATLPADANPALYEAVFTPTDTEAFTESTGTLGVPVTAPSPSPSGSPTGPEEPADLDVIDEAGATLDPNPELEAGQKVYVTARGYGKDAKVKVALAASEAALADATANGDGTVDKYPFTVPEDIADGAHTLTLTEDATGGHSVAFAFTVGGEDDPDPDPSDEPSESVTPEPSGTDGGSSGADGGGDGGAGGGGDGTSGGGGSSGGGGKLASTGTQAFAAGLGALSLVMAGAACVLFVRRRGLLNFSPPQH